MDKTVEAPSYLGDQTLLQEPHLQAHENKDFFAPDSIIKHTLEDGRGFEGTFEQAQKLCPFLGKMSTEEAIKTVQEADLATILAERGKAIRLVKEQEASPVEKPTPKTEILEPSAINAKAKLSDKNAVADIKHLMPNASPAQTSVNRIAEIARETALIAPILPKDLVKPDNKKMEKISPQPQLATSKKIEKVQHKTVKPTYIENKSTPRTSESKPKVVKPRPKVLPAITNNIADTIPVPYRHAQDNRVLAPRPVNNLVTERQPAHNQIKVDQEVPQIELAKSVIAVEPFVVAEQFDIMSPSVAQTETETLPTVDVEEYRTEQITPAEALMVYSEILALAENRESVLITQDIVSDNDETSDFTLEDLETVEDLAKISEVVNPLQTLIDQYPQPAEQIELVEIKNKVNEQTMGETIVQLAIYFSQNIEEKQDKDELTEIRAEIEAVEIKTILKEIVVELEKSAEDVGEVKITPQITHMLLTLLQTLGYENPRETLLKFVAQNSVDVLLQSIAHLHFLSDDSYPEFKTGIAQSLTFSAPANSSTITYIGKMLLEFITPFAYQKI